MFRGYSPWDRLVRLVSRTCSSSANPPPILMKALYFCARLPDMEASPIAELIVRNGRQQGAGRRLSGPVTIIGSAKGCDVRLNVDTVRPIHCFIALGPNGPYLRSWAADDTFVNDSPALNRTLYDGDVLRVGPFEFDIRWSAPLAEPADAPPPFPSSADAAAPPPESMNALVPVADDAKIRLAEDLYRQLSLARLEFRTDQEDREADFAQQVRNLAEIREELEACEEQTARQRSRLLDLRRRFIRRWNRHWKSPRRNRRRQSTRGRPASPTGCVSCVVGQCLRRSLVQFA
jgi:hypothetical protein